VILTFCFGAEFDAARIRQVATAARGESNGKPGLRSKSLTIDAEHRKAVYVYLWDSDDAARRFFSPERVELITALYGVVPSVRFDQEIRTVALARPSLDCQPVAVRSG